MTILVQHGQTAKSSACNRDAQTDRPLQAVLKLLALLSEVTSVFIQVRRTPTIQASDLEYIATFVSQVRSTLLQRPVAAKGDAGPADNFPALLIAHVMPLHLKRGEQEEKALEITKQALASQPEVIQTISENYVELSRKEGQGLHFDYLTLYELPMFKRFQQLMDTAKTPADLQEQVRNLVDMNEEPSSPLYKAGAAFLDDVDFLRDKIHNVSQVRTDGRGHAITPESFRQLLKWGVQEMNKVGPLNNVYLWEKIAIDACTKQLQDKIDELGAKVKEVAASQSGGLVEAISAATEELEDLFNGLNLQTNGKARESCDKMKASTWALATQTASVFKICWVRDVDPTGAFPDRRRFFLHRPRMSTRTHTWAPALDFTTFSLESQGCSLTRTLTSHLQMVRLLGLSRTKSCWRPAQCDSLC